MSRSPLAIAAVALSVLSCAQNSQQRPDPTHAQPQIISIQDGGVDQVLQSIVIPPMPNAPFSLILQTEWVQTLSDGGTITLINERHIARDKTGRIFQERKMLTPKTQTQHSRITYIQISDPNAHVHYNCGMLDDRHICGESTFSETTSTVVNPMGPASGPLPNGMGNAIREDLGENILEGVPTTGLRESVTYNPGIFGNDNPMTISREYWYAQKLGINLLSKRTDPRFGTQTFTVTNLTLGDPDPQLFKLPKGFTVSRVPPGRVVERKEPPGTQ